MSYLSGPQPSEIQNLFSTIATGYDRANDLMTFGLARRWRLRLVKWSEAKPGDRVLDVATGTGDLAFAFKKTVGPGGHVIGSDFCQAMLDQAPAKAKKLNLDVYFQWADATSLSFKDETFDVVSISYGIRNVSDPIKAINEMARVLKPGGRLMILETGDQQNPIIQGLYNFYFAKIVPLLGHLATGRGEAYVYLNKSSSRFPSGKRFTKFIADSKKFENVTYRSLMGGASFLYKATKLK